MPQRVIPPSLIPAGVLIHTAAWPVPSVARDLVLQLTENGDWDTVVGNILIWGYQISSDSGATWEWREAQNETLPFGTRGKNGLPPAMRVNGADVVADVGSQVRLAIQVDTAIQLGVTISTAAAQGDLAHLVAPKS